MSKLFVNRVLIEIMADIYTECEDEQQAGTMSEEIGDELVRVLEDRIKSADGCPGPDEVYLASWASRNMDIEEYKEDEE